MPLTYRCRSKHHYYHYCYMPTTLYYTHHTYLKISINSRKQRTVLTGVDQCPTTPSQYTIHLLALSQSNPQV